VKRILLLASASSLAFATLAMADVTTFDTPLAAPGVYFGNGNANSNFTTGTNNNIELGLSAIVRHVGPIDPGAGSNVYQAATGISNANNALWNFDFSVNTRADGTGSAHVSDYLYQLNIFDVSTNTQGAIFDPMRSGIPDNTGFGTSGKVLNENDLTTIYAAQNSENLGFTGFFPGFNPNASNEYKFTLSSYASTDTRFSSPNDSVTMFVNATPEPRWTAAFALALLIGVTFLKRRMGHTTA
jgi:hypothetical protein